MVMATIEALSSTAFSGRRFTRKQLSQVQETVEIFQNLSRNELALTICEHLGWKTPAGKLKINSCLDMLEQLETLGIVTLPAKRKTRAPEFQLCLKSFHDFACLYNHKSALIGGNFLRNTEL